MLMRVDGSPFADSWEWSEIKNWSALLDRRRQGSTEHTADRALPFCG